MSCQIDVVVTSFDARWLLVLRHVTWCIDELLTIVRRNRMECYELKMPLVVRSCRVVQGVTMWWFKELLCTTPVLLCTTKYYSSTTLSYTVLLRYYSVLQSPTPILQRTTPVLLCTTKYYSSTTLYYKVLLQYYSVLQSTTPVLLCPTQCFPRNTPVLLWNVIYNARNNKRHHPTSPNTAPATQNESHHCSAWHMKVKRHFQ